MINFKVNRQVSMAMAKDVKSEIATDNQGKVEPIAFPPQPADVDDLLVKRLDVYWENFNRQLAACQENTSFESVHDIRVATRRLLTLFELLQISTPIEQIAGMQTDLKLLRAHFDELRDTQVMISEMAALTTTIPEIEPFLAYLHKREFKHKVEVAFDISKYKIQKNNRKLAIAREMLLKQKMNPGKVERKILRYIDDSYQLAIKRMKKLDPEKPLTFHAVRIACRKFRYQVEVLNSLFLEYPAKNMTILKTFQDKLGEIQNHEVMHIILKKYLRKNAGNPLNEVIKYLDQKLEDAISAIMTEDAQLGVLWRPSRKEDFPWILTLQPSTAIDAKPGSAAKAVK